MIRVLLADDDRLVRQTFRLLLRRQADMEVVGEAQNGREAVDLAEKLEPDVSVMDVRMPIMDGLQATRILSSGNRFRVLVASGCGDEVTVDRAMTSGARGFSIKGDGYRELTTAIRSVHAGETYLSPAVACFYSSPSQLGLQPLKLEV